MIFVGVDWSEDHHDVALKDESGRMLAKRRLPEGVEGVGRFHELVAMFVEEPAEVAVAIETDRGLFVGALVAAGYQVYAINPFSVSRYRDRHTISGAKSDPGDAEVLADLVRTDRHVHRPVAGDSELAEAVKVLARAHQSLIWTRQRHVNALRSTLRQFYPAALEAFGEDLDAPEALAVLERASDPELGRRLSRSAIAAALRRAGRQRRINERAAQIQAALRSEQLVAPPLVAGAFAVSVTATVAVLSELNRQIAWLQAELADRFEQHPDAEIIRSLPGLGMVLGARVLGEFGDDPNRYADAKSRKNYAGTSPITKASGSRRVVLARHARNRRLADAIYWWAFAALTRSPGARALYDRQRAKGATHHQALRAVGNRLVGVLHGCLRTRTTYDETTAWTARLDSAA
ncbi:MAG: IS110 family transposase [Actinomycetota bacterium]|nr:IS110 family transposase [Actinomycetota bacterium]